jgi:hypothetical protein
LDDLKKDISEFVYRYVSKFEQPIELRHLTPHYAKRVKPLNITMRELISQCDDLILDIDIKAKHVIRHKRLESIHDKVIQYLNDNGPTSMRSLANELFKGLPTPLRWEIVLRRLKDAGAIDISDKMVISLTMDAIDSV